MAASVAWILWLKRMGRAGPGGGAAAPLPAAAASAATTTQARRTGTARASYRFSAKSASAVFPAWTVTGLSGALRCEFQTAIL